MGKPLKKWCPGVELNYRHRDFQSRALPTELPGHTLRFRNFAGGCPPQRRELTKETRHRHWRAGGAGRIRRRILPAAPLRGSNMIR